MAIRGTIDDFKASVVSDFARPNLFQVDLNFPTGIINNSDLSTFGKFTVRAANLPASLADVGLWLVVIFGCIILYNEICILTSMIRRWGQEK